MQVQRTIGSSDYVRRDMAPKNLIQPLAGEYGMHNNQPQRESSGMIRQLMLTRLSAAVPDVGQLPRPCSRPGGVGADTGGRGDDDHWEALRP
jgi:hypothetical protein